MRDSRPGVRDRTLKRIGTFYLYFWSVIGGLWAMIGIKGGGYQPYWDGGPLSQIAYWFGTMVSLTLFSAVVIIPFFFAGAIGEVWVESNHDQE